MDTGIKICGLTREQDIAVVNRVLPDYIGFVFWERSKRNIAPESAKRLKEALDKRINAVGVFVDADIEFIYSLIKCGTIDTAQLHGSEDETYISRLRERLRQDETTRDKGWRIIKTFNVNQLENLEEVEKSSADMVMLDSGKGSGKTFDWQKLKGIKRPYILAGGLSPENISEVISELKPYAVDVSSGVETDGLKDPEKIARFVELCRNESKSH